MKRRPRLNPEQYNMYVRGGDGKLRTQEECFRPAVEAFDEVRKIGEQRREQNKPRVVYDSGWYDWQPGQPLPSIESFKVPR